MSSSSSSAVNTSLGKSSSEETMSDLAVVELHSGHTVEFGVSWISSVRVQDMQLLGYFGNRIGWVPGAEEILEPEGEIVVFEAFITVGLRLPAHRFVVEVLQRFDVQIHQLTPNAVVALVKYVWAVTSYGGQPSVEVFAKIIVCTGRRGKLEARLHSLGHAPLGRGLARLQWRLWSWFLAPATSGAIGMIIGFMWREAKSKTCRDSRRP
jgi:hypothetical protein